MKPIPFLLVLLSLLAVFSAGYFPDYSGLGRGWYALSTTYSALFASLVMLIAVKQNNICKHFITIIALEFILMALYCVSYAEYQLVPASESALFDDNIVYFSYTCAIAQGLILTMGAPWGGILNGLLDFAKRALSDSGSVASSLLHAHPSVWWDKANPTKCR